MIEYRVHFSKESSLRWISHLELIKTMERAIRRAGIPLAYSEGFHPHARLSFGPALAVGICSIEEYFDMELTQESDPELLRDHLNSALPHGLQVFSVKRCKEHPKALNAVINRAAYEMILEADDESLPLLASDLNNLLQRDLLEITRINKNGQKVVNIRPWLHNLKTDIFDRQLHVKITGEIGSGGNLRPEDLLQFITHPVRVVNIIRVGIWHEEKGLITKPMDLC